VHTCRPNTDKIHKKQRRTSTRAPAARLFSGTVRICVPVSVGARGDQRHCIPGADVDT
ncbi:hypothetical protein LEMLEM_LOCUS3653, partial [Lemmus lemmus]